MMLPIFCLQGLFPEIIHAVGLTFFVVRVLPSVDAWYASLMFSLVAFIPALLNLHARVTSVTHNKRRKGLRDPGSRRRNLYLGFTIAALVSFTFQCKNYIYCSHVEITSSRHQFKIW